MAPRVPVPFGREGEGGDALRYSHGRARFHVKADAGVMAEILGGVPVWLRRASHLMKGGGGASEGGLELEEQEEGSRRSGPRSLPKAWRNGRGEEEARQDQSGAASSVVSLRWNQTHGDRDRTGW